MALNYQTVFFMRRYLMLLILTLLPTFSLSQVFLQIFSTMFIIAYIGREKPYRSPSTNTIEILNEFTVLVAAYPLLTFTDWVHNLEDRSYMGWFIIGCICLNLIFNITLLLIFLVIRAKNRCKYYFIRKRKLAQAKLR